LLVCEQKEIGVINKERQLGEKAKFYRNRKDRLSFVPVVETKGFSIERLQEKGINPDELNMLHKLTQASLSFVPRQN
jgi:hypothetical protein